MPLRQRVSANRTGSGVISWARRKPGYWKDPPRSRRSRITLVFGFLDVLIDRVDGYKVVGTDDEIQSLRETAKQVEHD